MGIVGGGVKTLFPQEGQISARAKTQHASFCNALPNNSFVGNDGLFRSLMMRWLCGCCRRLYDHGV